MGFTPRWYQQPLWDAIVNQGVKRAAYCWPRRHGKDLLAIHLLANMALRTGPGQPGRIGAYVYVFPYQNQARKVVWNGMDNDGKRFIHAFPPEYIESKNEAEMFIRLKNGSTFQVFGGDDPDKLVGTNPVAIVFSEYALTDPRCWQLLSPIVNANGGWVIFNSTPRGKNHFYTLLNMAMKSNNWYSSWETAITLGVMSPVDLINLRNELNDEALFNQEALCSFEAPLQGAYFGAELKRMNQQGRLREIPVDTLLPVDTAWDLGMDDMTAIWFIQRYRDEHRIVGYYENSGEGLQHYIRYVREWGERYGIVFDKHYAPHDIEVRELTAGGQTRRQVAASLGLRFTPVKRHSLEDGIEVLRNMLNSSYIDEQKTGKGLEALKSYCKEWDANNQTFKNRPLHNWASHAADALRQYAMGTRRGSGSSITKSLMSYDTNYKIYT